MSNEETMNSVWQALSMRLTVFPKPGESFQSDTWWANVANQEPEQRVTQPRLGKNVEQGSFENGKLVLSIDPIRIDWSYTPSNDLSDQTAEISTLGAFLEVLGKFSSSMVNWLKVDSLPNIDRIAYGAVLVIPVHDRKTGYERLSVFLKDMKIDAVGSSDFLYQINRSRESQIGIPNLKINRLSKWSVLAAFSNVFQIFPKLVGSQSSITDVACRLELDINTSPETELHLHRDRLSDVFAELLSLSKEIAEKGDIP